MKRRFAVYLLLVLFCLSGCHQGGKAIIMTVRGPIPASDAGMTLSHEHILVDFIGADSITESGWDRSEVSAMVIPYLDSIKKLGFNTFVDCTPAYLGRDPILLKALSERTGLNIITNTGFYGARNNKFIPRFAVNESAGQIAAGWVEEWESGIGKTGIKPGFIKIGVDTGKLSDFQRKLVVASALTHLKTGLTIASHTGPAGAAFEQLEVLKDEGVAADAFIWVHAQIEKDTTRHIQAAKLGAWVSFDGVDDKNAAEYLDLLLNMKKHNLLGRVLLSHDAGWYHPRVKNGGNFRGYTAVSEKLLPLLKTNGFTTGEIKMLLETNPAKAFTVKIRSLKM